MKNPTVPHCRQTKENRGLIEHSGGWAKGASRSHGAGIRGQADAKVGHESEVLRESDSWTHRHSNKAHMHVQAVELCAG